MVPVHTKFKLIFQVWKRLSRFQRNLIYFASVVMMLTVTYFTLAKESNHVDDGKMAVITESDIEDGLPLQNKMHNKVKAVNDVLNNKPVANDAPANDAQEDYGDEKMYEEKENDFVLPPVDGHGQKDSNEAAENIAQEAVVPPKDGSLKFKGPQNDRQKEVVEAFQHAWKGYKTYAWGHDHLRPISKGAQNWFGLGLTLIDSLDTMLIMNLKEDFEEAKEWVDSNLSFSINKVRIIFPFKVCILFTLYSLAQ